MARTGLTVRRGFDAAHFLPDYPGDCRNLHGHTWYVDVELIGEVNEAGFIIDFKDAKRLIDETLPDHGFINELWPDLIPTAENLSALFHEMLAESFGGMPRISHIRVGRVTVWETPTNGAWYEPL